MATKTAPPGKRARKPGAEGEPPNPSPGSADAQANLEAAHANLVSSAANLRHAHANLARSDVNLKQSEANLTHAQVNLSHSQNNLARSEAELARSEANLALAREFGVAVVDSLPIPLAVLDTGLRVRQLNAAFSRVFALDGDRVLGRPIDELVRRTDPGPSLGELIRGVAAGAMPVMQHEIACDLPKGPGFMLLNVYPVPRSPALADSAPVVMVNFIDVSSIRHVQRVEAALREKENLIKELHHRVKNNLQVISSLLELQALDTTDAKAQRRLKDSQERVRSMALIHEKLYRSRDLERIDMRDYVQSLAQSLAHIYGAAAGTVTVALNVDELHLDIDTAIPVGLIYNELISNVYKYAFPGKRRGHLEIALAAAAPDHLLLTVADDGVGLPPEFKVEQAQSLGLLIVRSLTEQLGGELAHDSGAGGARFSVRFRQKRPTG